MDHYTHTGYVATDLEHGRNECARTGRGPHANTLCKESVSGDYISDDAEHAPCSQQVQGSAGTTPCLSRSSAFASSLLLLPVHLAVKIREFDIIKTPHEVEMPEPSGRDDVGRRLAPSGWISGVSLPNWYLCQVCPQAGSRHNHLSRVTPSLMLKSHCEGLSVFKRQSACRGRFESVSLAL